MWLLSISAVEMETVHQAVRSDSSSLLMLGSKRHENKWYLALLTENRILLLVFVTVGPSSSHLLMRKSFVVYSIKF